MTPIRQKVIGAGLTAFALSRLHRLLAPVTRGEGAILTFHHVRPWSGEAFAPNRLLEITPEFLDQLLSYLQATGTRIVPLDDVPALLGEARAAPFVALTFDDGYRDNLVCALPVMERHNAPFTIFATTGFLDRTATLWWVDLEAALRRLPRVAFGSGADARFFVTETAAQKAEAFTAIAGSLEAETDQGRLAAVAKLSAAADVDARAMVDALCMTWSELKTCAAHPLVTIGCHTRTHPRLGRLPSPEALAEIAGSRAALEAALGRPVRHLAYPYGHPAAAGPREFQLARDLGFSTAVTTRPGVLFPAHGGHPTALPRISMNGLWQTIDAADVLLSGAALALWNRGRRLNVA